MKWLLPISSEMERILGLNAALEITNLMVDKHFICLAATCNVFTIYCKAHKVLLISVASEGTNL